MTPGTSTVDYIRDYNSECLQDSTRLKHSVDKRLLCLGSLPIRGSLVTENVVRSSQFLVRRRQSTHQH